MRWRRCEIWKTRLSARRCSAIVDARALAIAAAASASLTTSARAPAARPAAATPPPPSAVSDGRGESLSSYPPTL